MPAVPLYSTYHASKLVFCHLFGFPYFIEVIIPLLVFSESIEVFKPFLGLPDSIEVFKLFLGLPDSIEILKTLSWVTRLHRDIKNPLLGYQTP